jgi:2-aminoadipate transaminase
MSQLDLSQFELDRGAPTPLSDQLSDALERRIEDGLLPPDSRLPTTRELAASLGINRGTVQAAYRRLSEKGLVEGRVGSGTVVRGGAAVPETPFRLAEQLSHRAAILPEDARPALGAPLVADFSRLAPDERFFPFEEFTRTLAETWGRRSDLWQYAAPLGLEELRIEIARRLGEHGILRTADEILVTSGAQQGLDLLFRTFTDPGDLVAMESPTYSGALALARLAEAAILPLEMDEDGPDPRALRGRRVKLAYVMPERQNPTGVTTGETRRGELLEAALASGALVVEDGYEEPESGFVPISATEPERAVWLGTLSKDLVPGFRIGWIAAARPIVERLARLKQAADFQTPVPLQAAVAEFLRAGADRRIRAARAAAVAERTSAMGRALRHALPELDWWGGEGSNPLFWLRLPEGISGRRIAEAAAARGVAVAAGQEFDPRGADRPEVRLSASRIERAAIEPGVERLAEAIEEVRMRSSAALAAPVV